MIFLLKSSPRPEQGGVARRRAGRSAMVYMVSGKLETTTEPKLGLKGEGRRLRLCTECRCSKPKSVKQRGFYENGLFKS
jgi:hypothetical protein